MVLDEEGHPVRTHPHSAFPIIDSSSDIELIWQPDNQEHICIFCRQTTVDELKLGPLYRLPKEGVVTHYFCMLFSAGLVQNGDDRQGILGFLAEDILKEAKRAQRLKCAYCHAWGASIGCNTSRCKVSIHFPCGLQNEANFQFSKNYITFCKNHATTLPPVTIPLEERECPICMSLVELPERPIVGPCCKGAIFHKECLQHHALNAGYFFKCPTCNSVQDFPSSAKDQGIFVPEQDASWEREPNAFQDLYQQYNRCDAPVCECPRGRDYGANKGSWLLAKCRICGSAGTHRTCGKLSTIAQWACEPCLEVEARTPKPVKPAKPAKPAAKEEPVVKDEQVPSSSAACSTNLNARPSTSGQKSKPTKPNGNRKRSLSKDNSNDKPGKTANSTPNGTTKVKTSGEEKTDLSSANKRAKKTGIPIGNSGLLDLERDGVDLSQLHVAPSCQDYFPHNRESMKQFAGTGGSFPDWRNLHVQIEFVNVFVDAIDSVENPVRVGRRKRQQQSVQQTEHPPVNPTVRKRGRQPGTRIRRRRTNWSKGHLKPKKKSMPTQKPGRKPRTPQNVPERLAAPTTTPPVAKQSNRIAEKAAEKKAEGESQAILRGIKRSQNSLRQLSSNPKEDKTAQAKVRDSNNKPEPSSAADNRATENGVVRSGVGVRTRGSSAVKTENVSSTATPSMNGTQAKEPHESLRRRGTTAENSNSCLTNGIKRVGTSSKTGPSQPSDKSSNSMNQLRSHSVPNNAQSSSIRIKADTIAEKSEVNEKKPDMSVNKIDTGEQKAATSDQRQPTTNGVCDREKNRSEGNSVGAAVGIAQHVVLSLEPEEASSHLRILQKSLPHIFGPSTTNNNGSTSNANAS